MDNLPIMNMTSFFNRELFLYSLGDISLSKPVSLKKVGFLFLGLAIWTLPLVLVFGLAFNFFYLAILVGPPLLLAAYGDRPVFDGRSIIDATKVSVRFIFSKKCYADFTVTDTHTNPEYFIAKEVWIGRRRELQELADIWEERTDG